MQQNLTIELNQKKLEVALEHREMPLLWYLRDILKLKGTKFGCGKGLCGSCTVHVNGVATRACKTPVSELHLKKITTIEGISESHPVKQAWVEHRVPQCGYCQCGQIMSAVALLEKTPNPNDQQIDTAMEGNLCRCGTYSRIKAAIHEAAKNK